MVRLAQKTLAALLVLFTQILPAAEEPQALKEATAAHKEPLRALIAQAAKEGEVSYLDAVIQSDTNATLAAAFRKYYGLSSDFKVNYSLVATASLVTRVDQEVSAGHVTMDIAGIASLPWVFDKVRAGHVMRYESPQYQYYRGTFEKGLGKDGYFTFNGAYIFVPMWNPDKFNFKGASWRDVMGTVAPGRMIMGDAAHSPAYLATYIGLKSVLGTDYFKRVAEMKPVFIVRSEQIANQIVTGQNLLTFSGMPTRAYQFNKRGANLKFLLPKEGVVLLAQAMFILAKAPHPAAAKLWVDFILSETGQKIIVENEAMISGRSGFVSPVPAYAPAIENLNVIKVDWEKMTSADMTKARDEWLSIFNP